MRRPSRFPRGSVVAARVACLGAREPWGPAFVRAVYTANFVDDREIGEATVVAELLRDLGVDGDDVVSRAHDVEAKANLRANTDDAIRLGIFGAPSFVVGDELFWGNDRLEDALAWAIERTAR